MSSSVQLSPQAKQILQNLETVPQRILSAIAAAHDRQNQLTIGHIQKEYLSFAKDEPPVSIGLRVQSNRLRGSIRASRASIEGQTVKSAIGSNVVYAAIHEFGGETKPHRIQAKNGKALHFFLNGKPVFCKWINHPGSKFPARAYIRTGIQDRIDNYGNSISRAIVKTMAGQNGEAN